MTNLPPSPYGAADDDVSRSDEPGEAEAPSPVPSDEAAPPSPYGAPDADPASAPDLSSDGAPEPAFQPATAELSSEGAPEPELEPATADAPASPYRAADAGTPTAQPLPGASQPPSNLEQFYPQTPPPYGQYPTHQGQPGPYPQNTVPPGSYPQGPPQYGQFPQYPPQYGQHPQPPAPYGYAPGWPAPRKRGNGPGVTSLIFGIVAALIVAMSFGRASPLLFAVPGVIFGAIGMLLPHRPRALALGGLITSLSSIILAIVVTVVTSLSSGSGLNGSADQPQRDEPVASASPTPQSFGAPLGTDFPLTDTNETVIFTARVTASVLDANHLVLPVEGNAPAPEGMQWAMVTVDVTRLAVSTLEPSGLTVEYVSDGDLYTAADSVAVAPSDELSAVAVGLEVGATGSGSVVVAIPSGSAAGSWRIQCHDSIDGGGAFYSEVE